MSDSSPSDADGPSLLKEFFGIEPKTPEVRSDDSDIDALMGSVVGSNGQVIEFPSAPARAAKKRGKASDRIQRAVDMAVAQSDAEKVAELSGELAAQLDVPDEKPVIDPRTVPVRFSNLKHMARSALHYWDAVQLDRQDTLCMRLGRGAHAMVLGMPVARIAHRRGTKAWKAEEARILKKDPTTEILNAKEWATAKGMADAIRNHPIAAKLLFEGTVLEEQIEWEWLGRKCTSRPDCRRGTSMVADLKTTQCAEPEKFKRDAAYRGYNAQLAFYGLAVEHLTGVRVDDLYVVAVESKRPYAVTVLRMDEEARTQGEKLCRMWFERLLVCESSNAWPAYTDAIATFSVPSNGSPDDAIDLDSLDDDDPIFA